MLRVVLLLVWVIACCTALPSGAQCVFPSLTDLPLSQCYAVVDYPVYIPAGQSMGVLDAAAARLTSPATLGLVGADCAANIMAMSCGSVFRRCVEVDVGLGGVISLPAPPCFESCVSLVDACGEEPALLAVPELHIDCSAIDEVTGQPSYPTESAQVPLGDGAVLDVACTVPVVVMPFEAIPHGQCEEMQETIFSQCSTMIDYPVFVADGTSQKQMDFDAHNNSFAFLWKSVDKECSAAAFRFFCAASFPGCVEFPLTPIVSLTIPRGPCKSVCEDLNYFCGELLAGQELDCALLPPDVLSVPVSDDVIATAECITPPRNVTLYRECSPKTALSPDGDECVLECPDPQLSDSELTVMFVLATIFAWGSIFCSLLIWACFLAHPIKRQYPRSNPGWQNLYLVFFQLNFIIPSLVGGQKRAWCIGDAPSELWDGWYCPVSAVLVYIGAWMGIIWYNWVAVHLVAVVVGFSVPPAWIAYVVMHGLSWLAVVIWLGVMLITENFINTGSGGCVVDPTKWNEWFQDAVFWMPYTLLLITAVIMLLGVFCYTVFVMGWAGVKTHWRIMGYLLVGLFSVGYSSAYHWELRIEEDTIRRNLVAWLECMATTLEYDRCEPGRLVVFVPFLIARNIPLLVSPAFALILLSDPMFVMYWKYMFRRYVLRQRDVDYPFASNKPTVDLSASGFESRTGKSWAEDEG